LPETALEKFENKFLTGETLAQRAMHQAWSMSHFDIRLANFGRRVASEWSPTFEKYFFEEIVQKAVSLLNMKILFFGSTPKSLLVKFDSLRTRTSRKFQIFI
jgi:alpha-amylase/alpha-mannosidase (GH57 family)